MSYLDTDLNTIIARGRAQGYLTYDQVNAYLPDEDVTPEKVDNLLIALDESGIKLVDAPPASAFEDAAPDAAASTSSADTATVQDILGPPPPEEVRKLDSDPIRMYLSQMANIPLLSREEEIGLAKKIEVSRKRFRRTVLSCDFAMQQTVATLERVHRGELPFDRTIKVSLTERLTKEQILRGCPTTSRRCNTCCNVIETISRG